MARTRAGAAPRIDQDTCSLGRLAQSTCAACAVSCPHAALTATDEGLFVDTASCTGCGACLAACPQRAISLDGLEDLAPEPADGGPAVALICPRRAPGAGPCLQALGLEALSRLWLGGIRRIVAVTDDCAGCTNGTGLPIGSRVAELNELLSDRGLPLLRVEPAQSVARAMPRLAARTAPRGGRRAFLGLGAAAAVSGNPAGPALARLQSRPGRPGARAAFVPRIDPQACTGCDACLRTCPEAALSLIKDETGEMSYRTSSPTCTGCGLCMDVCGTDALRLARLAAPAPDLALSGLRCRGCGVEVHVPADGPWATGQLCPVCARTGHHKRLFQVLQ
jgi:Pyruvate/2-oxoacid:ferredoxin oxidoreductase delta subunit